MQRSIVIGEMKRTKLFVIGIFIVTIIIFYRTHFNDKSVLLERVSLLQTFDQPEVRDESVILEMASELKTFDQPQKRIEFHRKTIPQGVLNVDKYWRRKVQFTPLSQQEIDGVERFVLFIGYPRSGHSVIGSVIDGHPNAILAHEYRLFNKCPTLHSQFTAFDNKSTIFNELYKSSVFTAIGGWRSTRPTVKGYNLQITKWHGNFSTLKVIGDKSGGLMAAYFYNNYTEMITCYEQLLHKIQTPVLFIHVVRNPFDMIATSIIRKSTGMEDMRNLLISGEKIEAPADLSEEEATDTLHYAEAVQRVRKFANVFDIFHEDFVANPRQNVEILCSILHIPCPEEFVNACVEKVYKDITRSRDILVWPPALRTKIENGIKNYPFLSRYSF